MRKIYFTFVLTLFLSIGSALAQSECSLDASLVNQDPVHAVPGEYVKFVFQLTGLQNPSCGDAIFRVVPSYPFSFDPGAQSNVILRAGTYAQDYRSVVTIPYTLRVDPDALDENYNLTVEYGPALAGYTISEDFEVLVENVKADFDMFVQDYDPETHIATIDVLNTGENNVEALTAEVAAGSNLEIKGSTKSVIGALDASQDATFTIEIAPESAEIPFILAYTDEDGTRRTTTRTVTFNPDYFIDRQADKSGGMSGWSSFIIVVILVAAAFFIWRHFSRRRREKHRLAQRNL